MASVDVGVAIRSARKQIALSQVDLAKKIDVAQATISNWEKGKQEPDPRAKEKLSAILGQNIFTPDAGNPPETNSVYAEWLSKARQAKEMTAAQLSQESGVSSQTIYNIETGRAENPRQKTIELLEKALGIKLDKEFKDEARQPNVVEGVSLCCAQHKPIYVAMEFMWRTDQRSAVIAGFQYLLAT